MLSAEKQVILMRRAIDEARKSVAEDERVHPLVGAVLADADGNILQTAHRGELHQGAHAEFCLFEKVKRDGIDVRGAHLFVTLEPCTRRGIEKTPCAVRVAESGIGCVHIGTLDPNPQIRGGGELFLLSHVAVERFPWSLMKELVDLNTEFFARHQHEHVPAVSMYAGGENHIRPALASQRQGLLQQSMDLITGSEGGVWISSGGLSWLREMQIAILGASLEGRSVRILCDIGSLSEHFDEIRYAVRSLGSSVAVSKTPFGLRGTLVAPNGEKEAMICIERSPALHGHLFQAPHDTGVLDGLRGFFETLWGSADISDGFTPRIVELSEAWLRAALLNGVEAYQHAKIRLESVRISDLVLLPRTLERFKLFRLDRLAALRERVGLPDAAAIKGSPWPIIPPIVEERSDYGLVVIDGAHRVYSAASGQQERMNVLLVSGVIEPLPAHPRTDWDQIKIGFERLPRHVRYENLDEERFRPIRSAMASALKSAHLSYP